MFIRSERLFLRPAWAEDSHELATLLCGEAGVMSNMARLELPRSVQGVRDYIAHGDVIQGAERVLANLSITLPSARGAEIIGGIGLTRDAAEVGLGYWLARAHWGHGYAAEAARGMLAFARTLGHRRVFAKQSVDDQASLLALTRAGFRPTGEHRVDGDRVSAIYVADIDDGRSDDRDGSDEARAA